MSDGLTVYCFHASWCHSCPQVWKAFKEIASEMQDEDYQFVDLDVEDDLGVELSAKIGSQKKSKVVVIAESTPEFNPKNVNRPNKVGHIKMIVIPDLKASTIDGKVISAVSSDSSVTTDACASHKHFDKLFGEHKSQVINPKDIGKVLPWVHIAIANAKTLLADIYHGIKPEYLQEYLNEYCYKFNRRYFGEDLFERLMMIGASYRTDFEHRIYNKSTA